MSDDQKLLVEKLAEYAECNQFSLEELKQLIRICLQLERDYPGAQFDVPGGNARNVERGLLRQAQTLRRALKSPLAEMPPTILRPETTD